MQPTQSIKSDSASEKEVIKETLLKQNDLVKSRKKIETESENEIKSSPVVAEVKLECESRPLKIINNVASNSSNEISSKREEKKVVEVEEKEVAEQSISTSKTTQEEPKEKSEPNFEEDWECHHCTFVNDSESKVCTICCKTRVDVLQQLPKSEEDDIDINEINDSILQNENDVKQKGKVRKISFLPGTKAH